MAGIVLDELAELLLLGLPDVATLPTVRENFNAFRDVDAEFRRPARAHLANGLPVSGHEVTGGTERSGPDALLEMCVFAHGVRIAFHDNLLLFIRAFIRSIGCQLRTL